MYLTGVHLICVHLTGVYLMGVSRRRVPYGRASHRRAPHWRASYRRAKPGASVNDTLSAVFGAKSGAKGITDPWGAMISKGGLR
jgi:hypothetical protein